MCWWFEPRHVCSLRRFYRDVGPPGVFQSYSLTSTRLVLFVGDVFRLMYKKKHSAVLSVGYRCHCRFPHPALDAICRKAVKACPMFSFTSCAQLNKFIFVPSFLLLHPPRCLWIVVVVFLCVGVKTSPVCYKSTVVLKSVFYLFRGCYTTATEVCLLSRKMRAFDPLFVSSFPNLKCQKLLLHFSFFLSLFVIELLCCCLIVSFVPSRSALEVR
ncbi:hypothetical protein TbgDal_XI9350 [Trypanosoma brucei gambiense DAL972]|uniref:Uncharacterized protein n=1 Tax=Trypanosoma brucei gambiense (strain MHOM/CI/86/DAL972) TaxID=679716 RepID=D0A815_TRYB9|nr:hypothetical protein TbgDal_XI9350 [Trypanosoma brucei gambiense DAL972]CBH17816.1 hypothetical protein TbgDal_XI9350 [Trypanosoma brucei gambiense DAL972]|eukprot:XP_011780080.1 hypothetical protein TbgDal_XI9350 [Trypanosoma brucei gambiense DAL972]